jgi:hypothetical protein
LVRCKNNIYLFRGTKLDINSIEGYPELKQNVSFSSDEDLDIFILDKLNFHIIGQFAGITSSNLYRFLIKESHLNRRQHVRINVIGKRYVIFLNPDLEGVITEISINAIEFLPIKDISFERNKNRKDMKAVISLNGKEFPIKGSIKQAHKPDKFLFMVDKRYKTDIIE